MEAGFCAGFFDSVFTEKFSLLGDIYKKRIANGLKIPPLYSECVIKHAVFENICYYAREGERGGSAKKIT